MLLKTSTISIFVSIGTSSSFSATRLACPGTQVRFVGIAASRLLFQSTSYFSIPGFGTSSAWSPHLVISFFLRPCTSRFETFRVGPPNAHTVFLTAFFFAKSLPKSSLGARGRTSFVECDLIAGEFADVTFFSSILIPHSCQRHEKMTLNLTRSRSSQHTSVHRLRKSADLILRHYKRFFISFSISALRPLEDALSQLFTVSPSSSASCFSFATRRNFHLPIPSPPCSSLWRLTSLGPPSPIEPLPWRRPRQHRN